MTYQMEW